MRILRAMLGIVLAGVVACSVPVAAFGAGGDWTQMKYSSAQNPFNPAEKTISVSNVGSLQTAWVREFSTAKFVTTPLRSGSHLFSLISGGVIAMKATTGKTLWRIQLEGANSGKIGTANNVVYVATLNHLYALDAATGAPIWTFDAPFGSPGSVAISDGTVYLGGLDIYAVDAATGHERWHYNTGWGDPFPVVAGGVVYTRQTDELVALDAGTGGVLWTAPEEMPLLLYKTSLYALWGLHSLDAATGTQKWWNQDVGYAFVAANGRVYAQTIPTEAWASVNAGNGHILWTRPEALQYAALANGVIYANEGRTSEGTIRAIDATTGTEIATLPGHGAVVISHGVVYTVDNHVDGTGAPTLYALRP